MEDKPLLHIIPWIDEYEDRIKEVDKEELDNASFWYLHGKLQSLFGFDKGVMTNCKTLNLLKPYKSLYREVGNKLYYNGVIDCEVEGCDKPCIAYLYTLDVNDKFWEEKGLVCLKEDIESCEYAERKMNEKALIL